MEMREYPPQARHLAVMTARCPLVRGIPLKPLHRMVNYESNPQCKDSSEKLGTLYTDAKELAIRLIHEYQDYLDGKGELNQIYDYNFGSQLMEKREKPDEV